MTVRRPKSSPKAKAGPASLILQPGKATKRQVDTGAGAGRAPSLSVEQERDILRFELDAARERIADLEHRQAEIARRIASILKSLHTLKGDEA
jgi:hypothetical protein